MSWLEKLASKAGFRSLRDLAKMLLAEDWPGKPHIAVGSLAAKLSQLQRGKRAGVTWWDGREEFRDVLARALGVSVSDLSELVRAHAEAAGPVKLGDAIPFDPDVEPTLFPGAPDLPPEQPLLWWVPPSDSEREAVTRWLRTRHGFELVTGTWADVRTTVRPEAKTLLLLAGTEGARELLQLVEWQGRLWVVAPFRPRLRSDEEELRAVDREPPSRLFRSKWKPGELAPEAVGGWLFTGAQPAHAWRPTLCRWLAPRLKTAGTFAPDELAAWLDEVDPEGVVFSTTDTVCCLAAAVAASGRSARGYREAVKVRVRTPVLEAMREVVDRLITRGQSYTASRERPDWIELLEESKVRELTRAGHLRVSPAGGYALGPRWALDLIAAAIVEDRLDGGATQWGALLLLPETAALVLVTLMDRFRRGDWSAAERALEIVDPHDPGSVAAVEGAFRAAGIAALLGTRIDLDLGRRVWRAQMRLAVARYTNLPPIPRIGLGPTRACHPLLDVGMWFLAALALSESLGVSEPAELAPWAGGFDARSLTQVLWGIRIERASPAVRDAAHDLGSRLLDGHVIDTSGDGRGLAVPIQWPSAVVRAVVEGNLERLLDLMRLSENTDRELASLQRLLDKKGIRWSQFAKAVWRAWLLTAKENENPPRFCDHESPAFELMWRHVPKAAFEFLRDRSVFWLRKVPRYNRWQWHWIIRGAVEGKPIDIHAPWAEAPWEELREVLKVPWPGSVSPWVDELRRWILKTYPEKAIEVVHECLASGDLQLLWEMPYERTKDVVRALEEAVAAGHVERMNAVRWLHARIEARVDGWEDLYDRLAEWTDVGPTGPESAMRI